MPLIRLDMLEGRSAAEKAQLADVVYAVTREVFAAPEGDRYQILTEHPPGNLVVGDTGLGIDRSDGVVIVQVVQQGRSSEQKEELYRVLAERLAHAGLVRPEDLVVSVTRNEREDWSFGFGRAQFLTGEL